MKSIRCTINEHHACIAATTKGEMIGCDCPCHTAFEHHQQATANQMYMAHCAECQQCRSTPMMPCVMGRELQRLSVKGR